MKIDIFTYCDYFNVYGGKLCIVGSADIIFVPQFPAKITGVVVLKLRIENGDAGNHTLKTSIIDQDGKLIVSGSEAKINISEFKHSPEKFEIKSHLHAARFSNFQIPKFGEYTVQALIDGSQASSFPIYFVPFPQNPK